MTNLEGRVLRRRRAVPPPPVVRSELEIWAELARRLGSPVHLATEPAEVFDELARASAGGPADYSGISHARLDRGEPVYWPCPGTGSGDDHPGTPRLFRERFATSDGRARIVAVQPTEPEDDVRVDAPVYLVTGRLLQHYQSGAQTRRVPALAEAVPVPVVQMNPLLAERFGLEDHDDVDVRSPRGTMRARVMVTPDIRPDTVFAPFHFAGDGLVNAVTNGAADPISGMPAFKVCAVTISRAEDDPDPRPSEPLEVSA